MSEHLPGGRCQSSAAAGFSRHANAVGVERSVEAAKSRFFFFPDFVLIAKLCTVDTTTACFQCSPDSEIC